MADSRASDDVGHMLARLAGAPDRDGSFDHYARLVQRFLRVPTALVSLVGVEQQVFAGAVGLSEPFATMRYTPISHSFCQHVVRAREPVVVPDARLDPRLQANPAISELNAVAYAGWPLVDSDGRVVGSLCGIDSTPRDWSPDDVQVLQDLALACSAELQRTRRIVDDGETLARTIFQSDSTAMAFYDSRARLMLSNALAERAAALAGFALDRPPHVGEHVYCADHRSAVPADEQLVPRALRGEPVEQEMQWLGPPDDQIAVAASARRVQRSDGSFWGTLVTMHDVTDLALALRAKDDFVSTVSHELRTPLTSILGYLEILTDELDTGEGFVSETLGTMRRGGENLRRRIEELLELSTGGRPLQPRLADLSELGQEVTRALAGSADRVGVAISCTTTGPAWAVVDAGRIEQALENLVSNAVKYTGRDGVVRMTVSSTEEEVVVVVQDTGAGMTEAELAHAFEAFWRAEGARRDAVQGFGIGLTFVRKVVDAHRGTVVITSEPGSGTTVRMTLPATLDESLP